MKYPGLWKQTSIHWRHAWGALLLSSIALCLGGHLSHTRLLPVMFWLYARDSPLPSANNGSTLLGTTSVFVSLFFAFTCGCVWVLLVSRMMCSPSPLTLPAGKNLYNNEHVAIKLVRMHCHLCVGVKKSHEKHRGGWKLPGPLFWRMRNEGLNPGSWVKCSYQ